MQDAFAAAAPCLAADAVGLAATTTRYGFIRRDGDGLRRRNGEVELREVFDLRVFDGDTELRWIHQRDGLGRAVLLGDGPPPDIEPVGAFDQPAHSEPVIRRIYQTMLLWGTEFSRTEPGWLKLAEARIGSLDVPLDGPVPDSRSSGVVLQLYEYVAEGVDGNAYIVADRLCGVGTRRRQRMIRTERTVREGD